MTGGTATQTTHASVREEICRVASKREQLIGLFQQHTVATGERFGPSFRGIFSDRGAWAILTFAPLELAGVLDDDTYQRDKDLDQHGMGLIHVALSVRSTMCLAVLLDNGFSPNRTLRDGTSAIRCAVRSEYTEGIMMLLQHPDISLEQMDLVNIGSFIEKRAAHARNSVSSRRQRADLPGIAVRYGVDTSVS